MATISSKILILLLISLSGRAQLTTGLIDCWEFNEASGTVATAYNPAYNGTVDGATVNYAGKVGKCYDFDGADDLVSIPITTHYTDFSFSAWVYLDGYGEGNLGRIMDKGSGILYIYLNATGLIVFSQTFSTTVGEWKTGTGTIGTAAWYHIVVTYNNSSTSNNPYIYINGTSKTLTETSTPNGTLSTNAENYLIGNRSDKVRSFDGRIDQPAIWNKILTSGEVTQLYNAGAGQHFRRKDIYLWNNF